jgi:hypothetical protein
VSIVVGNKPSNTPYAHCEQCCIDLEENEQGKRVTSFRLGTWGPKGIELCKRVRDQFHEYNFDGNKIPFGDFVGALRDVDE